MLQALNSAGAPLVTLLVVAVANVVCSAEPPAERPTLEQVRRQAEECEQGLFLCQ